MKTGNYNPLPTLEHETDLHRRHFWPAAGIDEAGRGAWAGPVVAAAVVLPEPSPELAVLLNGVRDSKLMSPRQRSFWAMRITEIALDYGVGLVPPDEIDSVGIAPATRKAMILAVQSLQTSPAHLLIDHVRLPETAIPQTSITHGDQIVMSIAAASILAKVSRDKYMQALEEQFPWYGFSRNKGYGTREHQQALREHGICPHHRRSYRPIAQLSLSGFTGQACSE
jgi:ribonuclease HII